jgi:hypothetical protein
VLCTANFAQLYYELAAHIGGGAAVPTDPICAEFFRQIGVESVRDLTWSYAAFLSAVRARNGRAVSA